MPEHVVRWHQPQPENVDSWEWQFQRVGSDDFEWVVRVDPVDGCLDCYEAVITLPETALFVRSRSVGQTGESPWSHPLPVHPVPEPSFGSALALCILASLLTSFARSRYGSIRHSSIGGHAQS